MQRAHSNTAVLAICGLLWVAIVMHSAIVAHDNPNRGRTPIASADAIKDFALLTLDNIQRRSFAERKEFCGLILEDKVGQLSISAVMEGRESECELPWAWSRDKYAVATFHTHGAYNVEFDSEVPSVQDLESDVSEQIDGFVSTPGGRLWRIDWQDEEARLVCDVGCLASDPRYRPDPLDSVVDRFTLPGLKQRQE
ncbi:MAG: DUF4329 domain-containing protein [Sphingomonadaceae bacterium]|nr:DUF4329 domain-containing protein [Sphingomonadaceae bacterium]